MKLSKYNYFIKNNNAVILLNTLTGSFFKVNKQYDLVYKVLRNEISLSNLPIDIYEYFTSTKVIVPRDYDEDKDLDLLKLNIVDNKEQLNLIILPTEDCNFRCVYCYEKHNKIYMRHETQNQLIDFIVERIEGVHSINVDWFGGEPTMAIEIIESTTEMIKKICLLHKVNYVAGMTTNGYALTVDLLKRLKKSNIYSYQITLDGFQNTHDLQRVLQNGKKTWQQIVDNLIEIKNNYHSGMLEISIRVNLTRTIYDCYKEFIDFLKANFAYDKRFRFLIKLVLDYGNIDEGVKSLFCSQDEYMEVLLYSLQKGLYNASIIKTITPGGMLCYAFKRNSYVIQADGTISKCTLNLYNEKNNIGSLNSNKLLSDTIFSRSITVKNIKCKMCNKYPVCLKADCNMMTHGEMECEPDLDKLHVILPYIATKEYGCINI